MIRYSSPGEVSSCVENCPFDANGLESVRSLVMEFNGASASSQFDVSNCTFQHHDGGHPIFATDVSVSEGHYLSVSWRVVNLTFLDNFIAQSDGLVGIWSSVSTSYEFCTFINTSMASRSDKTGGIGLASYSTSQSPVCEFLDCYFEECHSKNKGLIFTKSDTSKNYRASKIVLSNCTFRSCSSSDGSSYILSETSGRCSVFNIQGCGLFSCVGSLLDLRCSSLTFEENFVNVSDVSTLLTRDTSQPTISLMVEGKASINCGSFTVSDGGLP